MPSFGEIGINTGSAYQTDPAGGFKPHGDGHPALQDVVLRQAMRRAVDNQTLVDKVLLGYGTPGISPVQPGATTGAWEPGPDDPDLSFNIAAANQMLDDAGYTMGSDGVRVDPKSGQAAGVPVLQPRVRPDLDRHRALRVGVDGADRDQAGRPDAQQQQAGQRDPRGGLRPVRVGLVPEPRPELHPEHLHVRAASAGRQHVPQLRQLLLQPRVRQALQASSPR